MMALLTRLFRMVVPVRKPILVRFYPSDEWVEAESVRGFYYAYWWPLKPFPIRLNKDGTGTIMLPGIRGTGELYPGFRWKAKKERRRGMTYFEDIILPIIVGFILGATLYGVLIARHHREAREQLRRRDARHERGLVCTTNATIVIEGGAK